jgi:surfactin synthase thioesterase subunit
VLSLQAGPARLLRARAQGIADGRRAGSVAGALETAFAVQAQDLPAAALGLRARAEGLSADAVRTAMNVERSVVRGWFMRGTLYLIPAADARWLTRLFGPLVLRQSQRRYRELGLDARTLSAADDLIASALSADGPLTRGELATRLQAGGLPAQGQVPFHLIRRGSLAGVLSHGPVRDDGDASFVLADGWLPPAGAEPELDDDSASLRLGRRYLDSHGPAAAEDFATWSGLPVPWVRRAWQTLAESGEYLECELDGQPCLQPRAGSQQLGPSGDVRLLPAYDNYLVGYRSRRLSVAPEYERRVWPGGGQIRATVSVDGLIRGVWSRQDRGRAIPVEPFEPLPATLAGALEAERQAVLHFAGGPGVTGGKPALPSFGVVQNEPVSGLVGRKLEELVRMTQLLHSRSDQRQALLLALVRRRTTATSIRAVPRLAAEPVPASHGQRGLWLVNELEVGPSAYNVALPVQFRGHLDVDALRTSLAAIVRRHEVLRTTFTERDGEVLQVIAPSASTELPVLDLSEFGADGAAEQVCAQVAQEQTVSFDLEHGPLLRARLLRLAADEHVLILGVHHIVFDGWSVQILHRELAAGYNALIRGQYPQLPDLPVQYADYSAWAREQLDTDRLDQLLGYWSKRLDGIEPLRLPTDRPVSDFISTRGATVSITLPEPVTTGLGEIARGQGASTFMTLSALLGVLFADYTGQHDLVFGSTSAERHRSELQSMIGLLNNAFVVRSDLSGRPGFAQLLRRTRDAAVADYAHSGLPFDLLVEHLQPPRIGNRMPLFRVHFQVEERVGTLSSYEELPGYDGLCVRGLVPEFVTAKFDMNFTMRTGEHGTAIVDLVYSSDLFDRATAERVVRQLGRIAEAGVAEPDRSVHELPIDSLPRPAALVSNSGQRQATGVDPATVELVTNVWREVLGRQDIDPQADFFDLGGNSFAVIKVRRLLGGSIPTVELFRHRTVLSLAGYLTNATEQADSDRLLWLLSPPDRTSSVTMVCVPYAGGNATAYQPLADALPNRFALLAASLPGHESGGSDQAELIPMAEASRQLADEVQRSVSGPVAVYGHCAGASLAIDLARELEDRGVDLRATYLGASLTDPDARQNLSRVTDSGVDELYQYIRAIGGFDGALDDADRDHVIRALRHDMADATRFQMAAHDSAPRRLRAPLHCILGNADPATPAFDTAYRGWEVFAESVSLDVLDGAGHYFVRDRATELAQIIDRRERAGDDTRIPVVCLAHTGAGASFFQPWQEQVGDAVRIVALELPGREKRFAEELCHTVDEAVADLLPRVLEVAGERGEVALFGHCLGAMIAYELAERLAQEGVAVRQLLLSGAPGPTVHRERKATGLPDQEFLDQLEELAGFSHPALEDADMAELLLPTLRADQEMYEDYRRTALEPLDIPIVTFRGAADTLVSAEDVAQWQLASTRALSQFEFDGGHMYHTEEPSGVLRTMAEVLS